MPNFSIASISRAVITEDEDATRNSKVRKFKLIVEGSNYLSVLGTAGVDARHCKSNHIKEVEATLGIEAARIMVCMVCSFVQ